MTINNEKQTTDNKIIQGIELGRVLAAIGVIYIHFLSGVFEFLYASVPFFFMASGYFLAKQLNTKRSYLQTAKIFTVKHLNIFIIWAIVYSLLPANWPSVMLHSGLASAVTDTFNSSLEKLASNPINWLLDGPPGGFHMWYLTSAPLAVIIIVLGLRFKIKWLAALIGVACLIVLYNLSETECNGSLLWAAKAKTGILISAPSLIAGYYYKPHMLKSFNIIFGTIILLLSALAFTLLSPTASCPTIPSITFGIGSFIVLASLKTVWLGFIWSKLGKLTLNAYLIHIAIRPIYYMIAPKLPQVPASILTIGFVVLIFLIAYLLNRAPEAFKFIYKNKLKPLT
jgi:hypothetical protein